MTKFGLAGSDKGKPFFTIEACDHRSGCAAPTVNGGYAAVVFVIGASAVGLGHDPDPARARQLQFPAVPELLGMPGLTALRN